MTEQVGHRVADWDTPLWVNPNRSPSRWWTPGAVVQYWSLHPLTPWAEYLRGMNVRDLDEAMEINLRPWVASLQVPDDVIEMTFDTAGAEGLTAEALVDDDWRPCQLWVAARRPSVLMVPSAALPGTTNLVLYGRRVRSRYGVAPVDPAVDVPTDPAAGHALVLEDLLGHVRWRGALHAGLEAWRSGNSPPLPPLVTVPRP